MQKKVVQLAIVFCVSVFLIVSVNVTCTRPIIRGIKSKRIQITQISFQFGIESSARIHPPLTSIAFNTDWMDLMIGNDNRSVRYSVGRLYLK